ncbi:hypothetical protein EI94DRAFT_1325479 [Lactarius quietus]|nr:hypothetical protein EI94DRAFT_1325479 [Lactarius quietus]
MLARGDIRGGTEKIKVTLNTSRTRNDFQPAHVELQLPLELLQKVFLLSVESKSYYQGYYARKLPGNYGHLSGPPEWIAITYVCRYWRLAALGLPELWSSINEAYSISWLRVMIERSAPLPMHIDIYISHINPIARLASLAAAELLASSRIRTLSLSGSPIDVLNVLSRLSNPSPIESLSLKVFDDREPVDLPDALFGRDAPHLRHLTFVSSAYIRAPLWLLSRITHFNIGASISRDVLLDMLNAMPQLEVLHASPPLNQTLVTEAPGQLRRSHAVLPRLSFLSIRDSRLYHFVTLSSYINARPTLRTRLHINLDPRWGITSNIFTDLRALFPHDSAPGMDDGGLRVAQVTGRPASGLFEVWSRTISRSGGASAGAFPAKTRSSCSALHGRVHTPLNPMTLALSSTLRGFAFTFAPPPVSKTSSPRPKFQVPETTIPTCRARCQSRRNGRRCLPRFQR